MTNFDKIKEAFSIEDVINNLYFSNCVPCPFYHRCKKERNNQDCKDFLRDCLNEEYVENDRTIKENK